MGKNFIPEINYKYIRMPTRWYWLSNQNIPDRLDSLQLVNKLPRPVYVISKKRFTAGDHRR